MEAIITTITENLISNLNTIIALILIGVIYNVTEYIKKKYKNVWVVTHNRVINIIGSTCYVHKCSNKQALEQVCSKYKKVIVMETVKKKTSLLKGYDIKKNHIQIIEII